MHFAGSRVFTLRVKIFRRAAGVRAPRRLSAQTRTYILCRTRHRIGRIQCYPSNTEGTPCGVPSVLAGVAGFGPTNARVKVWCLTAWLHPNVWNQLHYYIILLIGCQAFFTLFLQYPAFLYAFYDRISIGYPTLRKKIPRSAIFLLQFANSSMTSFLTTQQVLMP